MRTLLFERKAFLLPYLLLLAILSWPVLSIPRGELHLRINAWHSAAADFVFPWITHLGDGVTAGILTILFLALFSLRSGFFLGCAVLISGMFTQLLKRGVFGDYYRPAKYLEMQNQALIHEVPGVDLHSWFSFPSGHATAAFALCFSLALLFQRKTTDLLFLVLAILIAFSRVYLSQHFLMDVYVGSIIGVSFTLFFYHVFFLSSWKRFSWMDRSLRS